MTALGSKKHNATGRSVGRRKTNKRTRIQRQFAPRVIDMLCSPAFRVLSHSAHRILARLEIELANHGGADNGHLPCTYEDFVSYGIHRHSIAPALRELEALGFIEITERGQAGNREFRSPNVFRLTYRGTGYAGPTDEWERIENHKQAKKIAKNAREKPSQKNFFNAGFHQTSMPENNTEELGVSMTKSDTTGLEVESVTTLDITGVKGELNEKEAVRERALQSQGDRTAAEIESSLNRGGEPKRVGEILKTTNRDWLII